MEIPGKGRAVIQDNITELQILIPAKRNWIIIVFLGAWLGGWLMGEFAAIGAVTGLIGGMPAPFLLFWLVGWTVAGFFAFRAFFWNLKGKEIITICQGQLAINKKAALLFKPKTYDLKEVKNLGVQDDNPGYGGLFGGRRNDLGVFNTGGTVRFDYGLQTVKLQMELTKQKQILS